MEKLETANSDHGPGRATARHPHPRTALIVVFACLAPAWLCGTVIIWQTSFSLRCPQPLGALGFREGVRALEGPGENLFYSLRIPGTGTQYTSIGRAEGFIANSVYEVDVRIPGDPAPDANAEIVFAESSAGHYSLLLFPDGRFRIDHHDNEAQTTLAEGQYPPATSAEGEAFAHVAILMTGTEATIFINDEDVAAVSYSNCLFFGIRLGGTSNSPGGTTIEYSHPTLSSICSWDPRYGSAEAIQTAVKVTGVLTLLFAFFAHTAIFLLRRPPAEGHGPGTDRGSPFFGLPGPVAWPAVVLAGLLISYGYWVSMALAVLEFAALWFILRPRKWPPSTRRLLTALGLFAIPTLYLVSLPQVTSQVILRQTYLCLLIVGGLIVAVAARLLRSPGTTQGEGSGESLPAETPGGIDRGAAPILGPTLAVFWLLALPLWLTASEPGGPPVYCEAETQHSLTGVLSFGLAALTAFEAWAVAAVVGPAEGVSSGLRALGAVALASIGLVVMVLACSSTDAPTATVLHAVWLMVLFGAGVVGAFVRIWRERRQQRNPQNPASGANR